MKKFISILLLCTMCVAAFVSCTAEKGSDADTATDTSVGTENGTSSETTADTSNKDSSETETDAPSDTHADLESAIKYLHSLYKDMKEVTAKDYELVGVIAIGQKSYDVVWTVNVQEGVTVEKTDGNKYVVHVDTKSPSDIPYELTATIKDTDGYEMTRTYKHVVPAYRVNTYEEYVKAEKDDTLLIQGIVTGMISKSKDASKNCLFLQDKTMGGYYVYGMEKDPVADLKLEVGMTVEVSGVKDNYNGTLEIKNASVTVLSADKVETTPVDYTEIFRNASGLKDEALVGMQGMLVTLKGVEITDQDTENGYFNFKLGDKTSYIRLSGSTCALSKEEKTAFTKGHGNHPGYIANATGIISVYNGAFYLVPVDAGAFEYLSLPEIPGSEMIEKEAANLKLPERITDNTVLELPLTGIGYKKVSIAWTSDQDCAVIGEDGKMTVTLPETDVTLTVTAVLTMGQDTKTVTFTIRVESASVDVFRPEIVETPVKDTPYKFYFHQATLNQDLYFAGYMDGFYLATTDKADKGVDVTLEEVEGGFRISFINEEGVKQYIDIYDRGEGKAGVRLTDAPSAIYTYNETIHAYTTTVGDTEYFLGTYKDHDTISASKISFVKPDNMDKTQFIARFALAVKVEYQPEIADKPVKDTPYKLYFHQANLNQDLYFAGYMDGFYLATTDKADKAVTVMLEEVEGGFHISFVDPDGNKKYIDVQPREGNPGKVNIKIVDAPTALFTYSEELRSVITTVEGTEYYIGTYNTFHTISASKTSYVKPDNIDKTQFVARFVA